MENKKSLFWDTIRIFSENNILEDVILIGSWAEYMYEVANYFKGFEANLYTKDIDFLIKNIRKPKDKINLVGIMEKEGFVIEIDYISGLHKFYKDKELEIEFLVREMGKGQMEPYDVESFGIKAEGLRNLDILIENAIALKVKCFEVYVPSPQSYILHKMIISKNRKEKIEKDYLGIDNLLNHIKQSESEMSKLKNLYMKLTRKQKEKVDKFCKRNLIKLFN